VCVCVCVRGRMYICVYKCIHCVCCKCVVMLLAGVENKVYVCVCAVHVCMHVCMCIQNCMCCDAFSQSGK
jgi:hypothetical protein